MNVSGVVVRAYPESMPGVKAALEGLPGVDVYGASDDGRLVITVEETRGQALTETVLKVQDLKGVLSASMVYHYCDDDLHEEEGRDGTDEA